MRPQHGVSKPYHVRSFRSYTLSTALRNLHKLLSPLPKARFRQVVHGVFFDRAALESPFKLAALSLLGPRVVVHLQVLIAAA